MEWRHNDEKEMWEYGYLDIDHNTFVSHSGISDSVLKYSTLSNETLAKLVKEHIGSVPPPLEDV